MNNNENENKLQNNYLIIENLYNLNRTTLMHKSFLKAKS